MNKAIITFLAALTLVGCADDDNKNTLGPLIPKDSQFGKANEVFTADEWYPGGQLGTTAKASYSAAAPAVEMIEGMEQDFITGEDFFEHMYTHEQEPRKGLGPAWVRNSCIACHPSYGHGKRQTEYRANTIGNGYLLVIYNKDNNSYISEVTGMPQTQAMAPFKAPIDETQIKIEWKTVEQMPSGLSMTFHGTHGPLKRFTYAMTRGTLQDGAGANAIWNITNVTRSDRHWLYTTPAWAKAQSEDPEVIKYIKEHGADESSILHPYYADGTDEGIANRINEILSCNNVGKKDIFEKHLLWRQPYNGKEEMSDKQYYQFMVWHRGLAVPAARDLDDEEVKMGKKLFMETGCAQCHRPSWTTGDDNMWVDASIKAYAMNTLGRDANADFTTLLPKYPHQTIWPYTDMVQHRLFMANDIRTGWCRTTPLWGRGLSRQLTGADDRLHDCRARTVIEAIMWHGYSEKSDALPSVKKFHKLSKAERDAVVKFIESI